MNERKFEKKYKLQEKLIQRQTEQINNLKQQIEALKLELEKKDKAINSVAFLKEELTKKAEDIDEHEKEYKKLIDELRQMKEILNQTVYKGRWWLVKFLIK